MKLYINIQQFIITAQNEVSQTKIDMGIITERDYRDLQIIIATMNIILINYIYTVLLFTLIIMLF